MKSVDAIKLGFCNLWRMKFRSFLTILGVVIGISAILLFVSLGVGLQKITSEQITGMNALTTLTITQTPATTVMEEGPKLTRSSIEKFNKINNVERATGNISSPANVVSSETSTGAIVYGIDLDNFDLEVSSLNFGRKIENDNEAVITSALASAFSPSKESVIGNDVTIKMIKNIDGLDYKTGDVKLKVVGIEGNETAAMAYIPLEKMYIGTEFDKFSCVKVKVASRKDVDIAKNEIKKMGYQVTTIKDLIDQIDKIFLLAQVILGLIGGIGLFVSSLGIINTMTISFLERTHEIGIMKAIGATDKDIRKLFLFESALIGFLGGTLGVLIALAVGFVVNFTINLLIKDSGQHLALFDTPMNFAATMVLVAIIISILSGIYPTRRAQKLLPIDAIRQ